MAIAALTLSIVCSESQSRDVPRDEFVRASKAAMAVMRAGDLPSIETFFAKGGARPDAFAVAVGLRAMKRASAFEECVVPADAIEEFVVVLTCAGFPAHGMPESFTVRMVWTEELRLSDLDIQRIASPRSTRNPLPPGVREETVMAGASGWPLPGTMLVPPIALKPPVAVLIQDSGPWDRDQTFGRSKPFEDIALGLAARGIASFRFEKRTHAQPTRFAEELGLGWTVNDEVIDDAVAALKAMAARRDLGPRFIVAHGEGAVLAPRIAVRAEAEGVDVLGIVMLEPPSQRLDDWIVGLNERLSAVPQSGVTREMADALKAEREEIRRLEADRDIGAHARMLVFKSASAWLDLMQYDPAAVLRSRGDMHTLLIFGGRDGVVSNDDMKRWKSALKGRPSTTFADLPEVDHLMTEGRGPAAPLLVDGGRVSQSLIARVAEWMGRTRQSRNANRAKEDSRSMQTRGHEHVADVIAAGFAAVNHDH